MSGFKHIEFKISLLSYGCNEGGQSFFQMGERQLFVKHGIRSSLYGYGGGEFVSSGDEVFYASNQGLCFFDQGDEGIIYPGVFGDLVADSHHIWGVHEGENVSLVCLERRTRKMSLFPCSEKEMIGCIAIRPGFADEVAFIGWKAPDMPWDKSYVVIKSGNSRKAFFNPYGDSIMQIAWRNQNELIMIGEVDGWWNLMSLDIKLGAFSVLAKRPHECMVPLWQRGQNTLCVSADKVVFVEQNQPGNCQIMTYDFEDKTLKQVSCPYTYIAQLALADNDNIAIVGSSINFKPGVLFMTKSGEVSKPEDTPVSPPFRMRKIGEDVCGWFYLVDNAKAVIIDCHGGPTGQHHPTYDEKISSWASQGMSYCALDYRGSTGRGKAFREAIYGAWGEVDVDDLVWIIRQIQTEFPGQKVFLKGNSAGALTCILAASQVQVDGVFMRYPVLDIQSLLAHDSLFEGGYLHRLLPDWVKGVNLGKQLLACSTRCLIQTGEADSVVPIEQIRKVIIDLERQGASVDFHSYVGEGHGFKLPAHQKIALEREIQFVSQ